MIPMFLMPPVAGFLADRLERRVMLAWVCALQILNNLVLAILALTGVIEIWHVVLLSFLNGSVRATQMPVTQALLPNVVPRANLINAIALNASTVHGSRLFGAALIAPLLIGTGAGGAFVLTTGLYGAALLFSLAIRTASKGEMDRDKSALHNFFAGARFIYGHPTILPLMIVVVLHCCLTMSFESLLPVIADERLGAGDGGFSYLMMAVGAGALIGVLGLSMIDRAQTRGRLLVVTGVVSGIAPVGLALSSTMPLALVSAAGMGAAQSVFMVLAAGFIQAEVPDAIRGRVMSVYLWSLGGIMALFNLMNGALGDIVGSPVLLIVPGSIFAVVIPVSVLRLSLRQLYARGVVQPAASTGAG
jgi:MFS family permease